MANDYTQDNNAPEEQGESYKKKSPREKHKYWQTEIEAAQKRLSKWHRQSEKIVKRYLSQEGAKGKNSSTKNGNFDLNVFYSNTYTLECMLYGKIPTVDVSRRYSDANDDLGRVAAETMERLLNSDIAVNGKEVDTTLKSCLQDRLLSGLGCARVRYTSKFEERLNELTQLKEEVLVDEDVPIDYYFWGDVLWGWARNYSELPWVAFRNYMTKDEVAERFGPEIAKALKYSVRTVNITDESEEDNDLKSETKKAEIWEIWDKSERKVCWYNEEFPKLLDSRPDKMSLSGFFPMPPFLLANPTTTLYMPTPDFKLAEDLYNEIDRLQSRISKLTEAVKAVGVYDKSAEDVRRIFEEGMDNNLIPVDSYAAFAEKGGLRGVIEWVPIVDIVNALEKLKDQRNDSIGLLQQITGMADVMRGELDNQYEGVGQTSQKAKFASVRVQALQEQFSGFATDLMQLKAEVISRHFSPETIYRRSNMQYSFDSDIAQEAIALIKKPEQARLQVKIESESMAMVDYAEIKAERVDFMNAVSNFVQSVTPIIQQRPESEPFMLQLMQWGLSGFKGAQQIEGLLDKTIEASEQAAQKKKNELSPEEKAEQMAQQREQAKNQAEIQKIQQKAQADMQVRQQDMEADIRTAMHQHTLDMQKIEAEAQANLMEIRAKAEAEARKQVGDAQANVAQSQAATEQEVLKSSVQAEIELNKMVKEAEIELTKMAAEPEKEESDDDSE